MTMNAALLSLYEHEVRRLKAIADPPGEYTRPVFGQGPCNADLMLVGEAPGAAETEQGCPFMGKAGEQLNEMLKAVSLTREEIFITNAVKYRPYCVHPQRGSLKNRPPKRAEVLASAPLLRAEISLVKPRVVATLGNTPLLSLLGRAAVGELHGKALPMEIETSGFLLFPLYHPASVIYNRSLRPVLEADMLALALLLKNTPWEART